MARRARVNALALVSTTIAAAATAVATIDVATSRRAPNYGGVLRTRARTLAFGARAARKTRVHASLRAPNAERRRFFCSCELNVDVKRLIGRCAASGGRQGHLERTGAKTSVAFHHFWRRFD